MNLELFAETHGARKAGRAMANKACLAATVGTIALSDLPDTTELCDLYDELEGVIEENKGNLLDPEVQKQLKELISDVINEDSIESLIN